jgi:hypothetical protein
MLLFYFLFLCELGESIGKSHCFQVIGILDANVSQKGKNMLLLQLPRVHNILTNLFAANMTFLKCGILPFFSSMQD